MMIIKASIEHLKDITALRFQNAQYHSQILDTDLNKKAEKNLGELTKGILIGDGGVIFLVLEKDKAIGYIIGIEKEEHPVFQTGIIGVIDDIYVCPNKRNQDIGEGLVDRLYKYFREKNIQYVQLNVYGGNSIGMGFWKKLGFREERKTMSINI